MTLDVLDFIESKGGNAEAIRESQRKRGLSVEIVDEVIQMYTDWVKSACATFLLILWTSFADTIVNNLSVDFDVNQTSKEINAVQKNIAAKKKVASCDQIAAVPLFISTLVFRQKKTRMSW